MQTCTQELPLSQRERKHMPWSSQTLIFTLEKSFKEFKMRDFKLTEWRCSNSPQKLLLYFMANTRESPSSQLWSILWPQMFQSEWNLYEKTQLVIGEKFWVQLTFRLQRRPLQDRLELFLEQMGQEMLAMGQTQSLLLKENLISSSDHQSEQPLYWITAPVQS